MSFAALEKIADALISRYPESQAWNDSRFRWIRLLPPGSKHVVGKDMLTALIEIYGLTPTLYRRQVRVNGNSISVKVAMMWDQGIIKFQNTRDTEFDFVFLPGTLSQQGVRLDDPQERNLEGREYQV